MDMDDIFVAFADLVSLYVYIAETIFNMDYDYDLTEMCGFLI